MPGPHANLFLAGPFSQQATIETLSDDVLLIIFLHCLDDSPQHWPTLVHVCQNWREVVFKSPLSLHLRLYCTYGTPVLKTLDCWPSLPLVVNYGGSPMLDSPAPEDEENITAALKQSGRVSSISLTITNSLVEKLSAISEPFSELEDLALLSRDNMQLTLPSTFWWGRRLRTLYSTRIAFPSLPQLLLPSQDLVDLQLHEIPSNGHFYPEAFANALCGMTQLRTLSLHFLSLPPRRNYLGLPPPSGERVVLPTLTCLKYRGTSKYLDSFVARIDAPRLGDIDITFFSQPTMDASELGRFIERIEMQTSLSQADVQTSAHAISICFSEPGAPNTLLELQISCEQLDWQLSSMTQICNQFSPFLSRVEDLGIYTAKSPTGQDGMDGEQWVELIRAFGGANEFRVAGGLAIDILRALGLAGGEYRTDANVLPALHNLRVQEPMPIDGPLWDAAKSFITSRRFSGRPVESYVSRFLCHICNSTIFTQQQELKRHLAVRHAYRIVCSYCGDFEYIPGYTGSRLFREHLTSKHPEVAPTDTRISNPALQSFFPYPQDDPDLDLFGPFTELEAPNVPKA